jgi:hypothetical protein
LPVTEFTPHIALAGVLGHRNKIDEAKRAMQDLLRIKPEATIRHVEEILPFRNSADISLLTDGLRNAGMPE